MLLPRPMLIAWTYHKSKHNWATFDSSVPYQGDLNEIWDMSFKAFWVIDGQGISCEIVPGWFSLDVTDVKKRLLHEFAWCHQATCHYLSQRWPRSMSPYDMGSLGHRMLMKARLHIITNIYYALFSYIHLHANELNWMCAFNITSVHKDVWYMCNITILFSFLFMWEVFCWHIANGSAVSRYNAVIYTWLNS